MKNQANQSIEPKKKKTSIKGREKDTEHKAINSAADSKPAIMLFQSLCTDNHTIVSILVSYSLLLACSVFSQFIY